MKIVHFCNLIPDKLGAFEYLVCHIAEVFAAAGDQYVPVFVRQPLAPIRERLAAAGACVRLIPEWSDGAERERPWAFCQPALRILREERPDVASVHFGNELPSLVVSLLAPLCGARGIRWVWEQDQQICDPSALTRHLSALRLLSLRFDAVLVVYEGGRESFLKRGLPEGKISVIYNSIADHQPARTGGWLRRELGIGAEATLLVCTGWMVPRKRINVILGAFEAVHSSGSDVHLLVLGDGPIRNELEKQADQAGIRARVHFMGLRNDVRDVLAESDLFVHASLAETCTYAITESMCAGIPAVVMNAGAAREQIVDGETGYVLERADCEGLAARTEALVKDPVLRKGMGARARDRWNERYRADVAAAKYHAMYRALIVREGL